MKYLGTLVPALLVGSMLPALLEASEPFNRPGGGDVTTAAIGIKPLPPVTYSEIDVLVVVDDRFTDPVYATPAAWAAAKVEETNIAFAASRINTQLNLVGTRVVSGVPDVPLSLKWHALANPVDNILDDVHVVREELGADIVVMWAETWRPVGGGNPEQGTCGFAGYDAGGRSSGTPFAVVKRQEGNCTSKDFAHEVGHLLAADHSAADDPQPYSIPTARALKITDCGEGADCIWTIMVPGRSSANSCVNNKGAPMGCVDLDQFSNPDVYTDDGVPTGSHVANNAAAMNGAAPNVAVLRNGVGAGSIAPATGVWFSPHPNRQGHGLMLSRTPGDRFVAVWYTYAANGRPIWYISDPEPMRGSVWTAKLMEFRRSGTRPVCPEPNVPSGQACHVGRITLSFSAPDNADLYWQLEDGLDEYQMPKWIGGQVREPFRMQFGGLYMEGLYHAPQDDGWGFHLSQSATQPPYANYVIGLYYYDHEGKPTWTLGVPATVRDKNGADSAYIQNFDQYRTFNMGFYTSTTLCPGCAGGPGCRPSTASGTACPVGGAGAQPTVGASADTMRLISDPISNPQCSETAVRFRGDFLIGTSSTAVPDWWRGNDRICQLSTR